MTACSKDEAPVEEQVAPASTEPAEPPPMESSTAPAPYSPETVYFAFDSSELSAETQSKLNNLADYLRNNSTVSVQIEGHCDERGTVQYNLALGERRALSVKNFLTNLGIADGRLTTISYGEEKPVDPGHSEAAWAKNRRSEFILSN